MPSNIGKAYLEPGANNDDMSFGRRLEIALHSSKTSRKVLSAHVGVSVQSIGEVINGKTLAMTAENCARAAQCLRVNAFWLATGEGDMHETERSSGPPSLQEVLLHLSRHLAATEASRLPSVGKLLEGLALAGGKGEAFVSGLSLMVSEKPAPSWEAVLREQLSKISEPQLRDDLDLFISAVDDAYKLALNEQVNSKKPTQRPG